MEPRSIPYGRQHINEDDIQAVVQTLQSDFLTQGPQIPAFENAFAEYVGAKYAVAVANGTAALHLCALALDVQAGHKVITSPITFAASANCIKYCGGDVVFADINPNTALLDVQAVKKLVENAPKGTYKGIIPVDFAGLAVDMQAFRELANEHNLWIIEDACHAPGASFFDTNNTEHMCGSGQYADLAIFSFHPVKHIACGEGGMITTNNENLYKKLLLLRTHGITKDANLLHENHGAWYYEMQTLGYNYRLTDFQAALGISQLKRANWGLQRRKEIAEVYYKAFENTALKYLQIPQNTTHAYHLFVVLVNNRLGLYNYLRENNVFAQVHYIPVHLMPYYKQLGFKKGDFPQAENYYEHCLSLPMFPTLTNEEQARVIELVLEFVS
jgi:UDP-4-amino-4,6-dideoxy-N-acetyl-beta-L-altrosamine transaminase